MLKNLARPSLFFFSFFIASIAAPHAAQARLSKALVNKLLSEEVIAAVRDVAKNDLVRIAIENQNKNFGKMAEKEILALDKQWRAEHKSSDQPLIAAIMSNPVSAYLTEVQAHSTGLYVEMFIIDQNGLNVGQNVVTSDYWQGDEAKFQKTYLLGSKSVFIDTPEYNETLGIWVVQINTSVPDANGNKAVGALSVDLNLTELARRKALK